jgi:hypothetical protein
MISLKFKDLLYQALLEWPKNFILNPSIFILDNGMNKKEFIETIFDVSKEECSKNETYHLYDVRELISEKYFYTLQEIIFCDMHRAIFAVIRKSDLYYTNKTIDEAILEIKDFNKLVQLNFEKSIKELFEENYIEGMSIDTPIKSKWDWSYESLMLIKQYFEVNNVDMNSIS